ncbi:MAG: ferritin family protein, partial [Syntrophales bacterium]|nr:ferritin family protein [Syntrophales bacterium]
VLQRAIDSEEAAYRFYTELAERMADAEVKDTLRFLAEEEKKHKEFLLKYRDGVYPGRVRTLSDEDNAKIAEHMGTPTIKPDMTSKDVYLVAASRELNAHQFYKQLAAIHPEGEVRELLLRMAREELRHKEKMEYLYANTAFAQTAGG